MSDRVITVVGAGLAGCEAAWQLAERHIPVHLVEMKPREHSPAHALDGMAELVCSNSFRGSAIASAVGLLKEELNRTGSLLIKLAQHTRIPAGRALALRLLRLRRMRIRRYFFRRHDLLALSPPSA